MKSLGDKHQTEWEKASRQSTKREVKESWREEQKYRKKHGKPSIVGYRITAGKNCPHAKPYDGSTFLIEDVYDEPDLLPPYEGCRHDICECTYTPATADQREKARIILEFGDSELQAKLTTRNTSPVGFEHSSQGGKARSIRAKNKKQPAGCTSVLFASVALLSLVAALVANGW